MLESTKNKIIYILTITTLVLALTFAGVEHGRNAVAVIALGILGGFILGWMARDRLACKGLEKISATLQEEKPTTKLIIAKTETHYQRFLKAHNYDRMEYGYIIAENSLGYIIAENSLMGHRDGTELIVVDREILGGGAKALIDLAKLLHRFNITYATTREEE